MGSSAKEEEIFEAAIHLEDPAERDRMLKSACGGDAQLRARIERLLELDDTADDFLATPAVVPRRSYRDELPGTIIDRYQILERIGEGGFGLVYRAKQTKPVQRDVAIKVIKLGVDLDEVTRRYEVERQALAVMSHPNIATVFDAGSTLQGRPYFVMELVEGESIDEFCESNKLNLKSRLVLFVEVCRAMQHAHQKGIIHRDLKPSNVLVSDDNGRPLPKVIDFGIAKATRSDKVEESRSALSGYAVGTPEYMSPEQIDGEVDIDTRADVYALGGMLYKLLTGYSPLDLPVIDGAQDRVVAIRTFEPIPPSQRIVELEAERPNLELTSKAVRRDLDWIVMKALNKNRDERYSTAADVAEDIERFLHRRPVQAAPLSKWYRFQRFVHRNQVWFVASLLVCVALVTGVTFAVMAWTDAARQRTNALAQEEAAEFERQIAAHERNAAEQQRLLAMAEADKKLTMFDMLEDFVVEANPRSDRRIDAATLNKLNEFVDSLDGKLGQHPDLLARLRRRAGRTYLMLYELDRAHEQFRRALALREASLPKGDVLILESRVDLLLYRSRVESTSDVAKEADELLSKVRPLGATRMLFDSLGAMSRVFYTREEYATSAKYADEALKVAREFFGENHQNTLGMLGHVGLLAMFDKDYDKAERLTRESLKKLKKTSPDSKFDISSAKYRLAHVLLARRNLVEARQLLIEVIETRTEQLGEKSPYVIINEFRLASLYRLGERYADSEKVARRALAKADEVLYRDTAMRSSFYRRLANIVEFRDEGEAADLRLRALELRCSTAGEDVTTVRQYLGLVPDYCKLDRWDDAKDCLENASRILKELKREPRLLGQVLHQLADIHRLNGDDEQTIASLRQAHATYPDGLELKIVALIDLVNELMVAQAYDEAAAEVMAFEERLKKGKSEEGSLVLEALQARLIGRPGTFRDSAPKLRQLIEAGAKENLRPRVYNATLALLTDVRLRLRYLKLAETTIKDQLQECSDPLDRRRLARQAVKAYTRWNRPKSQLKYVELLKSEFMVDPDLDSMRKRLKGPHAHRALDELKEYAYRLQTLRHRKKSRELAIEVHQFRQRLFGDLHPDTLSSRMQLGFICKLLRHEDDEPSKSLFLEESKSHFEAAREHSTKLYGPDHPETLRCTSQIGVVLRHQRKFVEAEKVAMEAYKARKLALGDRLDTIYSLRDLTVIYTHLKRFDDAEKYAMEHVGMARRLYGEEHEQFQNAQARLEKVRNEKKLAE